jgi:glutathione peroxidase-family protein
VDVNGKEMSNLFKFLKRNSPLFIYKAGRAVPIKEHYTKFLLDRYGVVKHYYPSQTEMAKIEADIKTLI